MKNYSVMFITPTGPAVFTTAEWNELPKFLEEIGARTTVHGVGRPRRSRSGKKLGRPKGSGSRSKLKNITTP